MTDVKRGVVINGRYQARRKLGEGAFAEVWEAEDLQSPTTKYAIKLEKRRDAGNLRKEHHVLQRFAGCSRVVQSYGIDAMGDLTFMVLDLLGVNLHELRRQLGGTPPLPLVRSLAGSTLAAIRQVHDAGYIHRDIKPANFAARHTGDDMAAAATGEWVLLDFGLARKISDEAGELLPARPTAPDAAFRGSTSYASPAALRCADQGRRDDLWSWLYLLVELVTGGLPWRLDRAAAAAVGEGEAEKAADKARVLAAKEAAQGDPTLLAGASGIPLPEALVHISNYLKDLDFGDTPDYDALLTLSSLLPDELPGRPSPAGAASAAGLASGDAVGGVNGAPPAAGGVPGAAGMVVYTGAGHGDPLNALGYTQPMSPQQLAALMSGPAGYGAPTPLTCSGPPPHPPSGGPSGPDPPPSASAAAEAGGRGGAAKRPREGSTGAQEPPAAAAAAAGGGDGGEDGPAGKRRRGREGLNGSGKPLARSLAPDQLTPRSSPPYPPQQQEGSERERAAGTAAAAAGGGGDRRGGDRRGGDGEQEEDGRRRPGDRQGDGRERPESARGDRGSDRLEREGCEEDSRSRQQRQRGGEGYSHREREEARYGRDKGSGDYYSSSRGAGGGREERGRAGRDRSPRRGRSRSPGTRPRAPGDYGVGDREGRGRSPDRWARGRSRSRSRSRERDRDRDRGGKAAGGGGGGGGGSSSRLADERQGGGTAATAGAAAAATAAGGRMRRDGFRDRSDPAPCPLPPMAQPIKQRSPGAPGAAAAAGGLCVHVGEYKIMGSPQPLVDMMHHMVSPGSEDLKARSALVSGVVESAVSQLGPLDTMAAVALLLRHLQQRTDAGDGVVVAQLMLDVAAWCRGAAMEVANRSAAGSGGQGGAGLGLTPRPSASSGGLPPLQPPPLPPPDAAAAAAANGGAATQAAQQQEQQPTPAPPRGSVPAGVTQDQL